MASILRWQAAFCHRMGSPLYGTLLDRSAEDVEAGGPAWTLLEPYQSDDPTEALALRFMAAVHRIVLERRDPELAVFYPTAGGTGSPENAWKAFRTALERHASELRQLIDQPCQTNEVGRAAALLPGFLAVARETRLPLRTLEVGASAGLLSRWDHYRYEGGGLSWGNPGSAVRILNAFAGPLPLDGESEVIERRGCDPTPLDPGQEEDRLRLLSSIWADRPDRMRNLRGAFDVAGIVAVIVDRAHAGPWLERQLADPVAGMTTVVFHSVVLQYLSDAERNQALKTIVEAGERATTEAPFAWLRFEPQDWQRTRSHEVWLTVWPEGRDRKLAEAAAHGPPVAWVES